MTLLIAIVLGPLFFLTSCFAIELLVGLRPLRREVHPQVLNTKAVIVVPAHDEEAIIGETLKALDRAAEGSAGILVIADNCTDETAQRAREMGVMVVERTDVEQRGKGFALDAARNHLRSDPPEVVVILDADCWTDAISLEQLIRACAATHRPCQAVNLQSPAPKGSPAVQLSTFAFYVKNLVRQRALQRLADRIHLLGTGMAFPWPLFERAELATDNIVEDLDMGIRLAAQGHAPILVEAAAVWSPPETEKNTLAQRRRWEGGFLGTAWQAAPRLLGRSIMTGNIGGIWAALDLFIPPLALLVLLDIGAAAIAAVLSLFTNAALWPVWFLATSLLLAGGALSAVWASGGRKFVTLGALARIPAYVLWKLPLYLGFARRGTPDDWIRTRTN